MRNKKVSLVLALLFFTYFFSFALIRKSNTIVEPETEGCCTFVYWQQGLPYLIYSPLITIDEKINRAEYIFTGWKS